jgi:hypothetical protein
VAHSDKELVEAHKRTDAAEVALARVMVEAESQSSDIQAFLDRILEIGRTHEQDKRRQGRTK